MAHLHDDWTLRQGIEKLERSGYTAVPLIDRQGKYIGTVSEGDILRILKKRYDMNLRAAEGVSILAVERKVDIHPVSVDATMEDLVRMAMNQNFVPVVDDRDYFYRDHYQKRYYPVFLREKDAGAFAPADTGIEVIGQGDLPCFF